MGAVMPEGKEAVHEVVMWAVLLTTPKYTNDDID